MPPQTFEIDVQRAGEEQKAEESSHQCPVEVDVLKKCCDTIAHAPRGRERFDRDESPINAYKAVLGLLLAVVLLGEVPNLFGLIGVALIVAGSYFVIDRVPGQGHRSAFRQFTREPGVQLRFAALICSATESVFVKRALLLSSPITTFLIWTVLCFAIAATAAVLLRRDVVTEVARLRSEWRTVLWLAATTAVMALTTILTFEKLQVGYSLALFQLSTLITVYLGHRYFQERNIRRRLLGALVMVIGAMLIVTLGHSRG